MEVDCHQQVPHGKSISLCMYTDLKTDASTSLTDSHYSLSRSRMTDTSYDRIYECFQKGPPKLITDTSTAVTSKESNSENLERSQFRERNLQRDGSLGESSVDIPGVYFSYQLEADHAIYQSSSKHPTSVGSYISEGNGRQSNSNQSSVEYQSPTPSISQNGTNSGTSHTKQVKTEAHGISSPHSWAQVQNRPHLTGNGSTTIVPQIRTVTTGIRNTSHSQLDKVTHMYKSGDSTTLDAAATNEPVPSLLVTRPLQTTPLFTTAVQSTATITQGPNASVSFEEKLLKLLHMQAVEKQKLLSNLELSESERKQDQTGTSQAPKTQVEQKMKPQYVTIAPKTTDTLTNGSSSNQEVKLSNRKKTREEKLEYLRKYAKERRARETPTQREARLADLRARQRARKANETAEERLLRLEKDRIKTLRYRAKKKLEDTGNEDVNRFETIGGQSSSNTSAS